MEQSPRLSRRERRRGRWQMGSKSFCTHPRAVHWARDSKKLGTKKKEGLSIQGDIFILEKRRTSPYVVIHQQHPIEDGGEPGHVLERTAIRTRKWHGLGCGGYLGRGGQYVPQMLQKEEKVCRVG